MTTCPHAHFTCEVCQMYVFVEACAFIISCEIMLHSLSCIYYNMLSIALFNEQFGNVIVLAGNSLFT